MIHNSRTTNYQNKARHRVTRARVIDDRALTESQATRWQRREVDCYTDRSKTSIPDCQRKDNRKVYNWKNLGKCLKSEFPSARVESLRPAFDSASSLPNARPHSTSDPKLFRTRCLVKE